MSLVVNALVTGLIVFRILRVFLEVKATMTSVERTLGSSGGTKFQHAIFVIVESGMAMFVIQMVRVALSICHIETSSAEISNARNFFIAIHQMINVIKICSFPIFFCFLITFSWLGHRTNNNFSPGLDEFVLR